jgi:hypothetical protein
MKILPPTPLYNNLIMFFGQKGGKTIFFVLWSAANFLMDIPAHACRTTFALSSLIFNSFKRVMSI